MADYFVKEESLIAVADAIREKTGETAELSFPADFILRINALNSNSEQEGEAVPETTTITIDDSQFNYFEHITYTGVIDNEVTSIVLTAPDISDYYGGEYYFTINNILKNSTMAIVVGCDLDSYSGCEAVFTQSSADNDYGVIILSNIDNASITLVSTMDVMPDFG